MDVKEKPRATTIHHLHLNTLYRDAFEVLHASEALFASLSPDQLFWKPKKNAWSILECFDHLLVTNGLYIAKIEEAIEKAEPLGAEHMTPYEPAWLTNKFISSMRPGSSFRMRTFRIFKPQSGLQNIDVTTQFLAQQKRLLALIQQADQYDLNRVKLSSPESRLIRLSLGEALTLLVVHEQRHLLQAQNVQLHAKFPEFQS